MATIMMVDDKALVRDFIAGELAFEGYTVMGTGDIETALENIRNSRPDILILDLGMKGNHRWELLSNFKEQDPLLPILVISDFKSDRKDSRLELADGYLIKSFPFDELKQKIVEILARKKTRHARGKPQSENLQTCLSH